MAGLLTCLLPDLLNKDVGVTPEDTLLVLHKHGHLVGSVSHSIVERRKTAWFHINPKLKSLASTRRAFTPSSRTTSTSDRTLPRTTPAVSKVIPEAISVCSTSLGITLLPIAHQKTLPPAGRIRRFIWNWTSTSDDPWILEVVMGYCLELAYTPQERGTPREWFLSNLFLDPKKMGSRCPVKT